MKEIPVTQLTINPFTAIGEEWMLITAGNEARGYNTMTASWGHMGPIWKSDKVNPLPTAVVYLRPQRFTKEFVDREEMFTLSFFAPSYQKALAYLGSHSGREENKIAAAGLTPLFLDDTTTFAEASLTLVCRKLYHAPLLEEGFVARDIVDRCYPERDFHEMYVSEIIKVLRAED